MTNYNLFNDLKIKHKTLGHSVTRVSVTASVGQLSVHQHCWVVSEGPGARAIVAACNYTKVWAARGHGRYWLLQPITISARHNITHPQFQQGSILNARIFMMRSSMRCDERSNAAFLPAAAVWAPPRCYENRMYFANFERILQLELFWVQNCWHGERW